ARRDAALLAEELALLADPGRDDALPAELAPHGRLVGGDDLAPDLLAGAIRPFPRERKLLPYDSGLRHWQLSDELPPRARGRPACSLVDCNPVDFLQTGNAVLDFFEAGSTEVGHAVAFRLLGDLHRVAALHDDPTDRLGHRHDLIDADASLVPATALRAAARAVNRDALIDLLTREALFQQRFRRDLDRFLAVVAEPSREPLRDDEAHAARDRVRLHAHVDETGQRLRGVVRVQRREHEVAGLGGLDRDLGRLEV